MFSENFGFFVCFFVLMGSIFSNSYLSSLRMSMIIFFLRFLLLIYLFPLSFLYFVGGIIYIQ